MAGKAGRRVGKLTARFVQTVKAAGLYGDGAGLYLKVGDSGSKSWILRWARGGKMQKMGLGPLHAVSLAKAREKAADARSLILDHIDPKEARRERELDRAKTISFDAAAKAYIAAHKSGWKNAKHVTQWESTLADYASPTIGKLPVSALDVGLVLKILTPIWTTKNATAFRVRGRIEAVWAAAKIKGYCSGENPAVWRNNLDKLLSAPSKTRKTVHHPAMPYDQVPAFMGELRARQDVASRALEFLILCSSRTGEVIGAKWDEVDARLWTVPAERMKSDREHRVPLSDRAVEILEEMRAIRRHDYIFPGTLRNKPLGGMAFLQLLGIMGRDDITVHGFRSSFRDWAAECTNFQREVIEQSLAHVVGDATEQAYLRGDALDKRRGLIVAWSAYCAGRDESSKIVSLR